MRNKARKALVKWCSPEDLQVAMGSWWSYLWFGGDPDMANPISGLTKQEITAVQKSWAKVYANRVVNGIELLKRLFAASPHTKEYFIMIRNVPEEDYILNPQFKAHVINLMSSLNQAVENLNQPEVVVVMMNKLGASHGKRLIKEQDFQDLKNVIVNMFIEVLKLDSAALSAWDKTVDFWYKHIFLTLNNQAQTS